jgi:VCBS repeat-containing protein
MMAILLMFGMLGIQPAEPVQAANPLRISQVYGGGGQVTSTFMYDFIEIYNSGTSAVSLAGMSIQYASATGAENFGGSTTLRTELPDFMLGAGQYFLVQESGGANGSPLPTPNLIDSSPIAISATDGKIALVTGTTTLGCNGSATNPCPPEQLERIIDLVGYGTANFSEGAAAAPTLSNTTAAIRKEGGCTDTDNNSADFDALTPTPRNTASPTNSCGPAEILPTELFFSEYIEGSSSNKALEIYNGTGAPVVLTDYKVELYSNGNTVPGNQLTLTGSLASGDVYVIANSAANAAILAVADITSTVTYYDGDDALLLRKISTNTIIDSIGQVGIDPGTKWGTEPVTTGEHTLTRKETICEGDSNGYDSFDPALEWDGYAQDDFTHIGSHVTNCLPPPEEAPEVLSTTPANNGSAQTTSNITITFSEPVTVVEPWFSISCNTSSTHTAVVTDDDPAFTLNPDTDFVVGETCTVTIDHTMVNDDDFDDATADYMLADYTFSFTVVPGCGDTYTPIYEIQGIGETSPLVNQNVTTEGVVVGDFQTGGKNGYYIQDVTGDGDTATSDGIFVYNTVTAVIVGDHVRVQGKAVEYYGITEISPVTQVLICSTGINITPTPVTLPVSAVSDFEKYESMLVTFPQSLIISEYFNFSRYGEIVLTATRHTTPTAFVEPGAPAQAAAAAYLLDRITLDDGRNTENPDPAIHPNGLTFDMTNLFRGGGTVTGVTGVLDYSYDLYRIHPTTGATYENTNLRTTAPDITEGDLKIASFNVLNYFVTLTSEGSICGPAGNQECRGADTAEEFARQKAKILAAMAIIDADVFGLMEIENDSPVSGKNAVADLVAGLNAIEGVGPYDYIETGAIGTDVIKLAILYKPASVTSVGSYQKLDSTVDPRFLDTRNRPALAQVFMDNVTGDEFVVAVNHLKSKGSACTGEPDLGDGQGECNLTRLAAAQALVDWLADDSKFPNAEKKLIIGDLNSYDKEDPIDAIKLGADDTADTDDDYLDMIFDKRGEYAYGYVFDGQTGYLDHALANLAMSEAIMDVNIWHINADEASLIDYDMNYKLPAQDALYAPDAYRSSDHDPVIITLNMNAAPVAAADAYTTDEDTVLTVAAPGILANDTDLESDPLTAILVSDVSHGTLALVADGSFVYTPDENFFGEDSFTYEASDGKAESDPVTVTITVSATSDAPVALDQSVIVNKDTSKEITLVATDADGDTLEYSIVDLPMNGGVVLVENVATYTPTEGYAGLDSFSFKANDGTSDSNTATVTITVNTPPVAADGQSVTTDEDIAKEITLGATDLEDDPLEYSIVGQPDHGDVVLVDNLATYTPDPDFNGEDSFTFKVNDGAADSEMAVVTITVTPVNDAPMAVGEIYSTDEDIALTVLVADGVLANDTDVDGDTLSAVLVNDVVNGALALAGDGSFIYTPAENFFGLDSFTYKASDGTLESWTVTVTIVIDPVNDYVEANDDEYETMAGVTLEVAAPGVLDNDVLLDPDETVTLVVTAGPTNGSVILNSDGSFTYVPNAGFFGVDTFKYTLTSDILTMLQGEFSDTAIVTIKVTPRQIFLPLILR